MMKENKVKVEIKNENAKCEESNGENSQKYRKEEVENKK